MDKHTTIDMPATTAGQVKITKDAYITADPDDLDQFIGDCPRWCKNADSGHKHETFTGDRTHYGDAIGVSLELENGHSDRNGGKHYVEQAVAYLSQNYLDREPRIHVGKSDNPGVHLTPHEARAFGRVLISLADDADGVCA
jgi:hypothetical protein